MANTKPRSATYVRGSQPAPRRWLWLVLAAAAVLAVVGWYYRAPILGYAGAGSSYSAHVACSCRHIGGRSLEDCEKDLIDGMELVSLSEDADTQSVTARYPLLPSVTATYRKGYGCLLEPWED